MAEQDDDVGTLDYGGFDPFDELLGQADGRDAVSPEQAFDTGGFDPFDELPGFGTTLPGGGRLGTENWADTEARVTELQRQADERNARRGAVSAGPAEAIS